MLFISTFQLLNPFYLLLKISRQWKSSTSWNPSARVLLLMPFTNDEISISTKLRQILDIFLQFNMLHVKMVIHRVTSLTLEVITWFPFDEENCASKVSELTLIGRCECTRSGFQYIEYPTAEKVVVPLRARGCELRTSASVQEPYVIYNRETREFSGLEVQLVRNIASELDMRVKFVLINESRSNRALNYGSGIYSQLFQR